jgi:hypothetical protein
MLGPIASLLLAAAPPAATLTIAGPSTWTAGQAYVLTATVSNPGKRAVYVSSQPAIAAVGERPMLPYAVGQGCSRLWIGPRGSEALVGGDARQLCRLAPSSPFVVRAAPHSSVKLQLRINPGDAPIAGRYTVSLKLVGYRRVPRAAHGWPVAPATSAVVPVVVFASDVYRAGVPGLDVAADFELVAQTDVEVKK